MLKAVGASVFPVANTLVDAVKGVSSTVKSYKARNYKAPVDNEPKVKVKSKITRRWKGWDEQFWLEKELKNKNIHAIR
jgi:hypothetical protein